MTIASRTWGIPKTPAVVAVGSSNCVVTGDVRRIWQRPNRNGEGASRSCSSLIVTAVTERVLNSVYVCLATVTGITGRPQLVKKFPTF